MNWEAIGAVGEILGAIAVIGSLLFVGMQIRGNTRATQTAAAHNLTNTFNSVVMSISEDPELSRIWTQQSSDISALSVGDHQRLVLLCIVVLKSFEDVFQHHQMGQMSDDIWDGWQTLILTVCTYPGVRYYWQQRRNFYSRSFQAFLDNPPPIASMTPLSELIDSVTENGET